MENHFNWGMYLDNQFIINGSRQAAKPTILNVLLITDNDIGSLNSEVYVKYWFNKKWVKKAGISFYFTEHTSTTKLQLEDNRWRNKSLLGMIRITYNPFN